MERNVANQHVTFKMRDKTDPEVPITTGTPTITIDIDGVQSTGGTPTHIGKGSWDYVPTQAQTNGKHIQFELEIAGAIPSVRVFDPYVLDDFKANVDNLDVAVSTRMPTTHIDATGGKVNNVALVDTTTTNTDMRGTDNAATQASVDLIPKRGDGDSYRQLRDGAGTIQQEIRETITATEQNP